MSQRLSMKPLSQRCAIRVIVENVVLYTKVGDVDKLLGSEKQRNAVNQAIASIDAERAQGKLCAGFGAHFFDVPVQVDVQ